MKGAPRLSFSGFRALLQPHKACYRSSFLSITKGLLLLLILLLLLYITICYVNNLVTILRFGHY